MNFQINPKYLKSHTLIHDIKSEIQKMLYKE